MTEADDRKRVEAATVKLQSAEELQRELLVAIREQINNNTVLIQDIQRELIKLSRGLGVY